MSCILYIYSFIYIVYYIHTGTIKLPSILGNIGNGYWGYPVTQSCCKELLGLGTWTWVKRGQQTHNMDVKHTMLGVRSILLIRPNILLFLICSYWFLVGSCNYGQRMAKGVCGSKVKAPMHLHKSSSIRMRH